MGSDYMNNKDKKRNAKIATGLTISALVWAGVITGIVLRSANKHSSQYFDKYYEYTKDGNLIIKVRLFAKDSDSNQKIYAIFNLNNLSINKITTTRYIPLIIFFIFHTNYSKNKFPKNIVIEKDNINIKFNIENNIDFLLNEKINPIIPNIGHIKNVLNPNGFNSVNLFSIFIGRLYETINTITPITNVYFSILSFNILSFLILLLIYLLFYSL